MVAQGKAKVTKTARTTVARADDRCVADLAACEHPEQAVASGNIPTEVIATMVAAGAEEKRVDGQDLRVLQVDSVQSEAWSVYEGWASSLGKIDPMVQAYFLPPPAMQRTPVCPPLVLGAAIQDEANSIVYHFAPLHIEDFQDGIPALLAAVAPLAGPPAPVSVHHAQVAVTALLGAIRSPGRNFPVINGLHTGQYICHVHFMWRTAAVVVPIFRME